MSNRTETLKAVFKDAEQGKKDIIDKLIEEAVYLEEQMSSLKKYPFIKFHPSNPELQKVTAAGKQYREYLQTYVNIVDKLARIYGKEETTEESPLREYFKKIKAVEVR